MDFITGLLMTQQGHDSIWVIVDHLTKSTHFILVNTTYPTAMRLHGIPRTIISDQGLQFIAHF